METIKFRPLRRIKKTGKVTVASYRQWRKVMVADYSEFNLVLDDNHKKMNEDEYVYSYKGEQLFFFNDNPANIPVFQWHEFSNLESIVGDNSQYGILWSMGGHVNYNARGVDCDGVPTFSHYTSDYIATHFDDLSDFEPLTVGMVIHWFGWFLWQLNNSNLKTIIQ